DRLPRSRYRFRQAEHVECEPPDSDRRSVRQAGVRGPRVTRLFALFVTLALTATVRGADTDLVFPNREKPARLRVVVTNGDRAPEVAWAAFFDKLFTHFDRDGNGSLSEAEVNRVF